MSSFTAPIEVNLTPTSPLWGVSLPSLGRESVAALMHYGKDQAQFDPTSIKLTYRTVSQKGSVCLEMVNGRSQTEGVRRADVGRLIAWLEVPDQLPKVDGK